MRELVCGKSNPYSHYVGGFEGTDLVQRTSPPRMPMPCQEHPCKQKLYQPIDEQKNLAVFFFLYIVVRLCKQAFNTIYYVQKRVETDISTLFAHHSFSRTFRLRKVRDSNPRYNAMCTPHFECGSFDHSDNFPHLRVQRYNNFLN